MANFETIEQDYLDFLERHSEYDSMCSGIGSCEFCNKKLFPLRSKYLKAYINLYKNNKEKCPKLIWACTDSAKEWKLGDFHKNKCDHGDMINVCKCSLAEFIRSA